MKKLIIPVVAGLVLGLAGSTAAVALLGKEPATLNESLDEALGASADSAGAHGEHAEAPADSAALAHGDSLPADSAHLAAIPGEEATAHGGAPAAGHPVEAAGAAAPIAGGLEESRLAKVFATMPARDAAKVFAHMDDNEVQVILGHLGNREAAAIMSNLTPERAAVISRAVIRGERTRP